MSKPSKVDKIEVLCSDVEKKKYVIDVFNRRTQVGKKTECWPWRGEVHNYTGYGRVAFGYKKYLAHRLSFFLSSGFIDPDLLVIHACDNKVCVNPNHLSQGDYMANTVDAVLRGRHARGSKHGASKLDERDVIVIRRLVELGVPQKVIAAAFEVSRSSISTTVNKLHWSHV